MQIGVDIDELADQRFVLRERGSTTRRAFEAAIQDAGLKISPVFESIVRQHAATQQVVSNPATLLITKTNAQVRALNEEVRARLKASRQRLALILSSLPSRRSEKADSVNARVTALQREVTDADDKLKRLYRLVEDGVTEMDDVLKIA
jgi:hypothetical protein